MREQFCSDSLCGQKRSFFGFLRGSGYYFENGWYCSGRCLSRVLTVAVRRNLQLPTPEILIHRKGRIGAIRIQKGLITREDLELALSRQQAEGGLIGEWLVRLTDVSEADLMNALSEQQGVPWLNETGATVSKSLLGLLPRKLCFDYKIFPFEISREDESLRVAARSPIDGLLINMLRKMLGYEIEFFIVSDRVFEEMVSAHMNDAQLDVVEEISCGSSAAEISERIVQKAGEYGLNEMSLHFFSGTFWIRFARGRKWKDLFICTPVQKKAGMDKVAGSDRHFLPADGERQAIPLEKTRVSAGM